MKDADQPVGYTLNSSSRTPATPLLTPHDIKRFIKRYRSTILTCFLIGVLAAAAYSYTATPMYTARTQIIIDPSLPQVLRDTNSDTTFTIDNSQVESQLEVLRSEKIAIAVLDQLKLQDEPEFTDPDSTLRWLAGARPTTPEGAQRIALGRYLSNLYVRRVGVSYAIEILYKSQSPELAAKIANATADAYIREQITARAQKAGPSGRPVAGRPHRPPAQTDERCRMEAQEFRAKRDYRLSTNRAGRGGRPQRGAAPEVGSEAAAMATNTIEELDIRRRKRMARIYESYLVAYTKSVQKQSYPGH